MAGAGGALAGAGGTAGGAGGATGGAGGASAGTGGAAGSAGAAGSVSAGPCPSGWMCQDLGALGFTAKDKDGNVIMWGCGKGGLMVCDDATAAADCPELPNAMCAHLDDLGVISCTQRCTP